MKVTTQSAEKHFYPFNQNNSGGIFEVNKRVAHTVIIEATSAEQANALAQSYGIYFDGVEKDIDCPCCGDRWYEASDSDGFKEPGVFASSDIQRYMDKQAELFRDVIYVYYLDGTKVEYKHDKETFQVKKK